MVSVKTIDAMPVGIYGKCGSGSGRSASRRGNAVRDYHLHELTGHDFEDLIIHLCREVLGTGTVQFSEGPDGGRDGKFTGTANKYPSQASPWTGCFIIQAKRVADPTASCSDPAFETVLKKEFPKIKKLKVSKECDIYLIFTNRKLTGNAEPARKKLIKENTGVTKIGILGVETITGYLDAHEKVVTTCGLDRFRGPLRIQPDELRELIIAFNQHREALVADTTSKYAFDYVELDKKNALNNLRPEYFQYIEDNSLSYFHEIDAFLQHPINHDLREMYYTVADELQSKIMVRRSQFDFFEEIFDFVYDHILELAPELKPKRRLVNVFLHYMYCTCDIGRKK